jgi:protein-S-isoprenylcysteine O-methyltransferase Ste14
VTAAASKVIWAAFIVVWGVLRFRPVRRSRKTPVRYSGWDAREWLLTTISSTGLGILPGLYLGVDFPRFADYAFIPAQGYAGIATWLAALWLFYRTHRDLGRNWSLGLELRESHTLVTTGSYAHVRHPMYSAFWLMALAQALMLPNWIAGPAGLVGFGTLFFGRLEREEAMLIAAFGDEYRAYMRRTARVLPGIY